MSDDHWELRYYEQKEELTALRAENKEMRLALEWADERMRDAIFNNAMIMVEWREWWEEQVKPLVQ